MVEFAYYKSYNDKAVALNLYEKLKADGMLVEWETTEGLYPPGFGDSEMSYMYYVKLRKKDFKRADEIVMETVAENNEAPVAGYYLYSFTDRELVDVVKKPDEWNEYDRYWARKILAEKDINISEDDIAEARLQQFKEIVKPREVNLWWSVGVVFLLILALLGIPVACVGSLFLGTFVRSAKRTTPDGDRVFVFSEKARGNASVVLVLATVFTIFTALRIFGIITFSAQY